MSFLDLIAQGIEISVRQGHFQGHMLVRFQKADPMSKKVNCYERTITYTEYVAFKGSTADLETIICEEAVYMLIA